MKNSDFPLCQECGFKVCFPDQSLNGAVSAVSLSMFQLKMYLKAEKWQELLLVYLKIYFDQTEKHGLVLVIVSEGFSLSR